MTTKATTTEFLPGDRVQFKTNKVTGTVISVGDMYAPLGDGKIGRAVTWLCDGAHLTHPVDQLEHAPIYRPGLCRIHPAYAADHCPRCGTATVIAKDL